MSGQSDDGGGSRARSRRATTKEVGALRLYVGVLVTPCLGQRSCYSFAFGASTLIMTIALAVFAAGARMYATTTAAAASPTRPPPSKVAANDAKNGGSGGEFALIRMFNAIKVRFVALKK